MCQDSQPAFTYLKYVCTGKHVIQSSLKMQNKILILRNRHNRFTRFKDLYISSKSPYNLIYEANIKDFEQINAIERFET